MQQFWTHPITPVLCLQPKYLHTGYRVLSATCFCRHFPGQHKGRCSAALTEWGTSFFATSGVWRQPSQCNCEDAPAPLSMQNTDASLPQRDDNTVCGNPYLMDQGFFRACTSRSQRSMWGCRGNINTCWLLTCPKWCAKTISTMLVVQPENWRVRMNEDAVSLRLSKQLKRLKKITENFSRDMRNKCLKFGMDLQGFKEAHKTDNSPEMWKL